MKITDVTKIKEQEKIAWAKENLNLQRPPQLIPNMILETVTKGKEFNIRNYLGPKTTVYKPGFTWTSNPDMIKRGEIGDIQYTAMYYDQKAKEITNKILGREIKVTYKPKANLVFRGPLTEEEKKNLEPVLTPRQEREKAFSERLDIVKGLPIIKETYGFGEAIEKVPTFEGTLPGLAPSTMKVAISGIAKTPFGVASIPVVGATLAEQLIKHPQATSDWLGGEVVPNLVGKAISYPGKLVSDPLTHAPGLIGTGIAIGITSWGASKVLQTGSKFVQSHIPTKSATLTRGTVIEKFVQGPGDEIAGSLDDMVGQSADDITKSVVASEHAVAVKGPGGVKGIGKIDGITLVSAKGQPTYYYSQDLGFIPVQATQKSMAYGRYAYSIPKGPFGLLGKETKLVEVNLLGRGVVSPTGIPRLVQTKSAGLTVNLQTGEVSKFAGVGLSKELFKIEQGTSSLTGFAGISKHVPKEMGIELGTILDPFAKNVPKVSSGAGAGAITEISSKAGMSTTVEITGLEVSRSLLGQARQELTKTVAKESAKAVSRDIGISMVSLGAMGAGMGTKSRQAPTTQEILGESSKQGPRSMLDMRPLTQASTRTSEIMTSKLIEVAPGSLSHVRKSTLSEILPSHFPGMGTRSKSGVLTAPSSKAVSGMRDIIAPSENLKPVTSEFNIPLQSTVTRTKTTQRTVRFPVVTQTQPLEDIFTGGGPGPITIDVPGTPPPIVPGGFKFPGLELFPKAGTPRRTGKQPTGYKPSLIGLFSGRSIKKEPKGIMTGLEIRYPVKRKKRGKGLLGAL